MNIFSKKPSLPARPIIPSIEEIVDDLKTSQEDDELFKTDISSSADEKFMEKKSYDILRNISRDDIESPDKAYEKVKAFLDVYKSLDEQLVQIESERDKLRLLGEELQIQAMGVRVSLEEQENQMKY